ncbi:MAG TPA: thioredoxin [Bacteroidales bacterium]|nr:thioredoxin [Bacteroidales bacterium]HPE22587.1 thioredoxin [Bacteroidales bacterium]HPJ04075.1 thioredoxin [Bacteroidales bacterium]HPQ62736.1 thioredoxin [Bacteroidales bacterium]HRW26848.1 thioredoxin [Bacteroidales bacterium]
MKGLIIALVVIAVVVILVMRSYNKMKNAPAVADSELIEHLTAQNFAHKTKNGVVLVDFWADWCMPCKMMAPILNEVAAATDGTASIFKLNVDEQQQIAAQYGIRSIPTMILFKDGKEVERIIGVKPKDAVLASIRKVQ